MSELPAPIRANIASLETSGIAKVFDFGFGRDDLIPLWVGEGDQPTPRFICDAASAALNAGKTFYTYKRGIPELRGAIAAYTAGLYGIHMDLDRITVTASGMNGIMQVLQAIAGPGDNVAVVTPVWPNIMSAVQIVGAQVKPVGLDLLPEGGFRLDLDRVADAIDGRTRALFIATPGNPTGWVMSTAEQRAVLALARERGIWLIADEVYARFIYDGARDSGSTESARGPKAPSFLELATADDPLIVVNSFSKAWAMTGWRMGWLIAPPGLGDVLDRLIEFNTSGSPHFLQYGCVTALRDGEPFVRETVERCRRGGELVFQRLSAMRRVRVARPQGAFYIFFAVAGMDDSLGFAKRLVNQTKVGLAPGSAFGPGGEGHLRLCFASSAARLAEAMDRLAPVLDG